MSGGAAKEGGFSSPIEFILTVVSYAVGLGNVWRFPYLVFDNGGAVFLIVFIVLLIIIGIPIFMIELVLGQFSGLGPAKVFYRIAPITQGVGYAAVLINAYVGFYYNLLISYFLYYLFLSMNSTVPWSKCEDESKCKVRNATTTCEEFTLAHPPDTLQSPSEKFFYEKVLHISDSIADLGSVQWPIALCLLACWTIVFLALVKGVQSLGKISYFTATIPYVMLTILLINGALLRGAGDGIYYYIGSVDASKFGEPLVYKNAAVQAFYSLSACTGGLIVMSKFNPFNNNLIRDSFLVPFLDCFTGFYAGFAIFAVLGHMYNLKCPDTFADVVKGGPELAFIVYPEGLSYIVVPPLWSILFFLMMLALGFGSQFSIVESVIILFKEMFQKFVDTRLRDIAMRGTICAVFFLFGISLSTEGGFYILSLINDYGTGYTTLFIGICEVIIVPWIYGCDRFIKDIELMVGPKPKWFWMTMTIIWKFISPIAILAIIISNIALEKANTDPAFPSWSVAIGWILVAIPPGIVFGCAVAQMYIYKFNWKALFSPDEAYYERSRKFLAGTLNYVEDPIDAFEFETRRASAGRVTPSNKNDGNTFNERINTPRRSTGKVSPMLTQDNVTTNPSGDGNYE